LRWFLNSAQAAGDFSPLPGGEYPARIVTGLLDTARSGTLGFKLTFEVTDGEFAGRKFWHDIWLTAAAMPMSKRDLLKLGITDLAMLDRPLPSGIRVKAKLVVRKDDNGGEHNRVKSFEVTGIDGPDPFAPDGGPDAPAGDDSTADVPKGGDHVAPF
jgi:hypothetical protein